MQVVKTTIKTPFTHLVPTTFDLKPGTYFQGECSGVLEDMILLKTHSGHVVSVTGSPRFWDKDAIRFVTVLRVFLSVELILA